MNSTQSLEQPRKPPRAWHLIAADLIALISLLIILCYFHFYTKPFVRGFHCDDESIAYPVRNSTVSSERCYYTGFGVNILIVIVLEYFIVQGTTNRPYTRDGPQAFPKYLYVRRCACRLAVLLFGAMASELLTDIAKVYSGRLRPHFKALCDPKVKMGSEGVNWKEYCEQPVNQRLYILDYECVFDNTTLTGLNITPEKAERDIRLSFLSGHSSFSAYSAIFAVLCIQNIEESARLGLLRPTLQVIITLMAFITGLTRVSDYKHHWQDVLAGELLGITVASLVSLYVWPALYKRYSKYLRLPGQRAQPTQSGGELTHFTAY